MLELLGYGPRLKTILGGGGAGGSGGGGNYNRNRSPVYRRKGGRGDWAEVFESQEPQWWGTTEIVPELSNATRGDTILAYQTDRNELVGVARVVGWKPQGKFKLPYGTLPRKGWIMLQDHHAAVEFKNIKLKPLP